MNNSNSYYLIMFRKKLSQRTSWSTLCTKFQLHWLYKLHTIIQLVSRLHIWLIITIKHTFVILKILILQHCVFYSVKICILLKMLIFFRCACACARQVSVSTDVPLLSQLMNTLNSKSICALASKRFAECQFPIMVFWCFTNSLEKSLKETNSLSGQILHTEYRDVTLEK